MAAFSGSGTLRPGDVVNFDRADTWLVTGQQGLYLVGGVTYTGDAWGGGTRRAIIRANADLAAGIVRFRDHATSETTLRGFELDGNNRVTSGVDINHAFWVAPMTGAMKRVQDTEIHHITARLSLGQYKYGLIISNFGGTGGAVENVEILNAYVHDVPRDAICLYPGDSVANSRIKNITVRGSEVHSTGQDPDYCCGAGIIVKGYVQDAFIEYNYVHDVKGASIFVNSNETNHYGEGQRNIHIRHNIVSNSTSNGAIRIYDSPSGGDPKDIKIYGNLVYNSTALAGLYIGTDLKLSMSLLVYNNTFYNAPVVVRSNGATINQFEFRNNIVYSTSGTPLSDDDGDISVHSNNLYFRASGTTLVSSRGMAYTAGSLASYEGSAATTNPAFQSTTLPTGFTGSFGSDLAPNTDGFRPTSTSMAVDRGFALPATYASSINSVARPAGNGWELGAFELGSGTPALPAAPTNLRIISSF